MPFAVRTRTGSLPPPGGGRAGNCFPTFVNSVFGQGEAKRQHRSRNLPLPVCPIPLATRFWWAKRLGPVSADSLNSIFYSARSLILFCEPRHSKSLLVLHL